MDDSLVVGHEMSVRNDLRMREEFLLSVLWPICNNYRVHRPQHLVYRGHWRRPYERDEVNCYHGCAMEVQNGLEYVYTALCSELD